ncbi:MAG: leucine-rich repeat domain-containing protein [Candidatus Aenigmarchaeota archaeon]|nr:leucine-rich repeat domain-containing protein [Candidatus Aenigmarchaeota archaeon]
MCGGNDCDDSMTDDPYIDCPNPSIPICAKPTASCAFCTNPNSEEICANDIDENCDGITFNGVEIITTPGDGQQLRDPKHPTTVQTLTCKATIEKTPDIEKSSLGFVFDIVTPKKSYQKIMGHDEIECSDDGTVCWADHKISQTLTRLGEDVTCSVKSYRIVNGNKEYSKSCESKLAVPICPPDAGHKKIKPEEMEVDDNGNWKDQKELFTVCAPGLVKFIDEAEDSCSSKGQSEAIYKTCLMDYILKEGLGPGAKFMRGYFAQEICCKGGDFIGPAAIYHCDTVSAFGLGDFCTAKDVPENYKPLDYDSLNCIKKEDQPNKKVWITNGPGWKTKNSCYFEHLPATSSLLVLGTDKGSGQGTGTCVDYSIAVTTLLRMGGFKPNEVYTSFIIRHAFNIVKKPGEEKFSVVDVTGNKPPYAYEKMPGDMCLIKDIMNDVKKMTLNIAENDYNLFVKGCLPEGTIVCENIKYNAVTSGGEIKLSPDSQKTLENEIKKNGDVELENIEDLKCLTSLKLKFLSISNIDPLKTLTNLESLYLSSNQILDIDPLKTLTGLRYLHLSNNQYQDDKLSNIDPLKTLTSLRHLKLNSNQISDIDPLKTLTNLEYLALYYNQISDIDPLKTLTNLKELYLYGNQISPQDCADLENYFKGKGQPVIIDGCPTTQPPITGNMITGNTIQKAAPSEIFSFEVSEPELSDSEKIYDIMITLRNPHDSETDITYFVDQLNFEMETIPNVDYDWYYLDDYGAKVFEFTETLGSDETVERDFSISVNQLGEIYFPISVDYGNEVSHSETIIITAECNQNSVCETDLTENYFNCPDCLSGSEDGVCDLVNDGIVDPDCIEGSDFDYVIDACSDGMLSGDEEGVDCGGTCPECLPTTKEDVLKSVNFWILGEKIIQDIIETLRQWIGWF